MKITVTKVAELNPCHSRFENFKQNYPGFSGSVQEFLSLDNITYSDKIWVCVRLMTRNQKFYWARACVNSVLHIFEAKYPADKRVRELIEFMNGIDNIETITAEQLAELRRLRSAADAADADAYAAYAAAAYAADAADADADAYAAYAAAAYAAAYAADAADAYAYAGRAQQEEFNLIILKEIMELDV